MAMDSEIVVTLPSELHNHVRIRATDQKVPLEWLVAGLVCDTIAFREMDHPPGIAQHQPQCL